MPSSLSATGRPSAVLLQAPGTGRRAGVGRVARFLGHSALSPFGGTRNNDRVECVSSCIRGSAMDRPFSIFVAAAFLVGACAAPTTAAPDPTGVPAVVAAASTSAAPASKTLEITAFDLGFKPATLRCPARRAATRSSLINTGAHHARHHVRGRRERRRPNRGESVSVTSISRPAAPTFLCSIPGHAAGRV